MTPPRPALAPLKHRQRAAARLVGRASCPPSQPDLSGQGPRIAPKDARATRQFAGFLTGRLAPAPLSLAILLAIAPPAQAAVGAFRYAAPTPVAASEPTADSTDAEKPAAKSKGNLPPPGPLETAGQYLIIALAIGVAAAMGIVIKRRMDDQATADAMADARFEAQALASLPNLGGGGEWDIPVAHRPAPAPAEPATSHATQAPAPERRLEGAFVLPAGLRPDPVAATAHPTALAPAAPPLATDEPTIDALATGVITQLRNSGLYGDFDSYVEVHGQPKAGMVIRLRDGRKALIVPNIESEPYLRRNLRRYELVLCLTRDGKALVINSLENIVAEKVGGRMGL